MLIVTYNQLKYLHEFSKQKSFHDKDVALVEKYLSNRLTEATSVYVVTKEFPTTHLDNKEIMHLFVTKVLIGTSSDDLKDFHKRMSAETNS